jgi:diguanylate cyclase (GGDEF)-like protein
MVNERKLSTVLSEFASTLATDFPIQAILDHLVERIVDVLPVTGAGVTLIAPGEGPRYVAASDETARYFEQLQSDMDEGPCMLAYQTGEPVAIAELTADDRFPRFSRAAVDAGLAAVFTFPLHHGAGRFGALDLYRTTPGGLDAHTMSTAQTLADVAAAYLLNAQGRLEAHTNTDRFRHIALHDALTGLPNRLMLQQRIDGASADPAGAESHAAILFVDLDRFKRVNDTHGHQVGDELLKAVAERLAALIRPGDTLARVAGDEFVFLCENMPSARAVEVLARRIDSAFARPFLVGGAELTLSASVGTAYAGPGEGVSDHLVAKADTAMYEVKRQTTALRVIAIGEEMQNSDDYVLARELRVACAEDMLDLVYQPIVRSRDGLVTGVEALLRWNHPERGPIPALAIIGLAEHSGIIGDLGAWVLERACQDRSRWMQQNPDLALDLAVNVSAHQLVRADFCESIEAIVARTSMDPSRLVLEMTEDIVIEDSEQTVSVMAALKKLGIRLALDDFGTGYSSLSYLDRLPIDIVKIDQSFISHIGQTPRGAAIVAAVTNLAHALELTVIAEGIETRVQRNAICAIGCEAAQGFYYAQPMTAAAVSKHLGAGRKRRPRLPHPRDAVAPTANDRPVGEHLSRNSVQATSAPIRWRALAPQQ